MKKILFAVLLAGMILPATYAEEKEKKSDFMANDKTLFEQVTGVEKKQDKFNLFLNMNGSFDLKFNNGFEEGSFYMRQLRIEAKGQLNNWLSYRYRQRLNRPNNGADKIDNLPTSIDIAGIGIKLNERFSLFAGKQCTAYGGFEFDLNPIEIYQYSDMIDNMSNFMTGLNLAYEVTPSQQLQLQILNSRNNSMVETYGEGFESTKLPLVYTLNWNGNFNNVFKTRWSASVLNETRNKKMYYFAFGNEISLGKFTGFYDFMYSKEDIDRKGIITGITGTESNHNALDAAYMSMVLHLNYRIAPKWNLFVKGMYETASTSKERGEIEKGKYRTSWGYLSGIEYYPMETNLHFFVTYVGRSYIYANRAKALGQFDYNTNRLSVGFIYQLPVF